MRWVSAISDLDDTAGALASVGAQVQEQLAGERPDLLLVFSTPDHAVGWDELGSDLLERLGGHALAGCSGGSSAGDVRSSSARRSR